MQAVLFIHEKNIAHRSVKCAEECRQFPFLNRAFRDLCALNIMYNAEKVYPKGYHPASVLLTSDVQDFAPRISRTAAGGVRYYVTDFGISTRFNEGEDRLVKGVACQDDTVPELSNIVPYNPFPVDIYTLGNVFKEDLLDVSAL